MRDVIFPYTIKVNGSLIMSDTIHVENCNQFRIDSIDFNTKGNYVIEGEIIDMVRIRVVSINKIRDIKKNTKFLQKTYVEID